jgi:arylsulfatase A-like enzyme
MKTAGQRTRALVELVDLYPTLAQLCALPLPTDLEGTSFAPLLEKPNQLWKKAAFSQYLRTGKPPYMGRSIRTDRWRYTEWDDGRAGTELYDHSRDPHEMTNLAPDPTQATTLQDLQRLLRANIIAAKRPTP